MRLGTSCLALSSSLLAIGIGSASAQERGAEQTLAREQIDRSLLLRPGAAVSVEGIAGPVTIETGSGSHAEIHIRREAPTQRELDCTRTEIENRNGGLSLRQLKPDKAGECRNIRMRQTIRLILPRNVDLALNGIAGKVEIGAIDGGVRLRGIAGSTKVSQARSADISSVAGRLMLGLGQISRGDVRVSSVAGSIDLVFRRGANADIVASSVIGRVTSATPAVQVRRENNVYRARIGAGGARISLTSVVGQVRLDVS
jgi:hypothetical protein